MKLIRKSIKTENFVISVLGSKIYVMSTMNHSIEYIFTIFDIINKCISTINISICRQVIAKKKCDKCDFYWNMRNLKVIGLTDQYFIIRTGNIILIETLLFTNYGSKNTCTIHKIQCEKNSLITFLNNNLYIIQNNKLYIYEIVTRNKEKIKLLFQVLDIYNDDNYLFLVDNKQTHILNKKLETLLTIPIVTFGCFDKGILLNKKYTYNTYDLKLEKYSVIIILSNKTNQYIINTR